MTEITYNWKWYIGTAVDDHGVFKSNDGEVYAGEIADGSASVGVATMTNGDTYYAECDERGVFHGRHLPCAAAGDTYYLMYDRGSRKEWAVLRADGTCTYDGKACRADYAPFVKLKATVLPIKARPHQWPHSRPLRRILTPTAPQSVHPFGHCFGTPQALATFHAEKVRARLRHQPARPRNRFNPQQLPNKCAPGGRVHYACATNHVRRAPFSRPSAAARSGLQAKKAVAAKKAAKEAEQVRSSPPVDGFGLHRTASIACSCGEWQHPSHSHRGAMCTTPRRAIARARAYGGAMGATACAFALL
jgi:hypothetical protein